MKMQIGKEYTLKQFITAYRNEFMTVDKLYFKCIHTKIDLKKIILNDDPIITKYNADLKECLVTLTLTDEEFAKYKYNPKALSYYLYGTTELWPLLIHANEIYSISQFNFKKPKVYTAEVLQMLESIFNIEKPIINENAEEINEFILNN